MTIAVARSGELPLSDIELVEAQALGDQQRWAVCLPHLRRVLQDDGLQQGLRGVAAARVGVPVARKLEALLQLLWGQTPAISIESARVSPLRIPGRLLTCSTRNALCQKVLWAERWRIQVTCACG